MSQIGATHNEATHNEATPVDGPKIRKIKRVVLKISEKKQKAADTSAEGVAPATSAADTSAEGVVSTNAAANAEGVVSTSAKDTVVLRTNTFSSKSQEEKISLYIQQLTEQQKIVLNIAKEHLATSFCIEKSLGYLSWLKTQQ
jgi:hypothetical protein